MNVPAPLPWRLKPLHVPGLSGEVAVPPGGLVLGRDPEADVVVDGERFPGVSGRHARLEWRADELWLADLESTNGTRLGAVEVKAARLQHGDVLQLGPEGPRFAVLAAAFGRSSDGTTGLARTAIVRRQSTAPSLEAIRADLGLDPAPAAGPESTGPRTGRRPAWVLVGGLAAVALGAWLFLRSEQAHEASHVLAERLDDGLTVAQGELARQREDWQRQRDQFERAREEWEAARRALEIERDGLELRLGQLEAEGATWASVRELSEQLDETTGKLARFDPAQLERTRVEQIQRVERAVVLIEAREVLVEPQSGRVLRLGPKSGRGQGFQLDGDGEVFARESTGSGVCLSAEGHVLTNAHVVAGEGAPSALLTLDGFTLEPRTELWVVFSGTSLRHRAELLELRRNAREDLALLKIAPFEGIPHVDGVDLTLEPPPRGSEVFALGFPLGKRVLQAGDVVIASAFRGIVSRAVDPFVQVDAAVHPGASGGPVIDAAGRVVGLITAMQSADPRATSSQIGYMLPIQSAAALWPPR